MDRVFRFLCQAETRRLLTLLGITVALVLVIQYSELPYSKMLSSLIPSIGKVSNFQMESSSINSEMESKNTRPNGSSSNHKFDAMASGPAPVSYELDPGRTTLAAGPAPEKARGHEYARNFTTENVSSPLNSVQVENIDLTSQKIDPPSISPPPMVSLPNISSLGSETDSRSSMISVTPNATSVESDTKDPTHKDENPSFSPGNSTTQRRGKPMPAKNSKKRPSKVVSISEMNALLHQSHASSLLVVCTS